jgi:hypothetical protein
MRIRDTQDGGTPLTTDTEDQDISQHLADYPNCDGSLIVDDHDQTTLTARPYLYCNGCDVAVQPA